MNIPNHIDPLGNRRIVPVGYARLEYLETTGTQRIDTGIVRHDEYRARFEYAAPPAFISGEVFGWGYKLNGEIFRNMFYFNNTRYFGRFVHYSSGDYILPPTLNGTGYDGTARNVLESTSAADRIILNGKMVNLSGLGSASNATNPLNTPISLLKESPGVKVFSFTIFNDSNLADVDLIPILDNTGEPCMFDFVTRKPFYNSGTGTFIAGVENQVQLNNLLRKLPDRTGQDVGTLQVRLADELQTPENEAKLDAMLAKNWEISQAA